MSQFLRFNHAGPVLGLCRLNGDMPRCSDPVRGRRRLAPHREPDQAIGSGGPRVTSGQGFPTAFRCSKLSVQRSRGQRWVSTRGKCWWPTEKGVQRRVRIARRWSIQLDVERECDGRRDGRLLGPTARDRRRQRPWKRQHTVCVGVHASGCISSGGWVVAQTGP